MSDFDDEPRGRSATGAVIIAVIFLALLGTGVGLVLGSQAKDKTEDTGNRAAGDPTPTAAATNTPGTGNTPTSKATNTRTPSGTGSYRPTSRERCPQQTEEAAGTTMSVKRYVRTDRSEVWICSGGGKLVYQGRLRDKPFRAATSDTTLFIGSVRYEAGVFAATNGDTTYFVGPDALRREKNGVEEANEPVEDLYET